MGNLADSRKVIQQQLAKANAPVCLWTSDARSQLLLYLIREIQDVPILVFKDWWNDLVFVTKMVTEQKLTAYFYRPVQMDYKEDVITSYYNLAQKVLPITTSVVKSNRCGLDWGRRVMNPTPMSHYVWDVTFAGSKDTNQYNTKSHAMVFPLTDWTDDEIEQAVAELGIPVHDQSKWHGCMACQDTRGMVWCPKENRMIEGIGV